MVGVELVRLAYLCLSLVVVWRCGRNSLGGCAPCQQGAWMALILLTLYRSIWSGPCSPVPERRAEAGEHAGTAHSTCLRWLTPQPVLQFRQHRLGDQIALASWQPSQACSRWKVRRVSMPSATTR